MSWPGGGVVGGGTKSGDILGFQNKTKADTGANRYSWGTQVPILAKFAYPSEFLVLIQCDYDGQLIGFSFLAD